MYVVPVIIGFLLIPSHYEPLYVVVCLMLSASKPQYKAPHQQKPAAAGDATPNRPQQKQKPFQHQANGQQAKKRPAPPDSGIGHAGKEEEAGRQTGGTAASAAQVATNHSTGT